ncbi:hypothetical protein, partial [Mycobacterium tuberculosis]|uniref:hypothetical protein n=1 Tax=Mycobacterium tuberculosis TaxID=1773 RepID=UPI001AEA6FE6|nr:hypothetical protein [Mycobacterium tuberculosis]
FYGAGFRFVGEFIQASAAFADALVIMAAAGIADLAFIYSGVLGDLTGFAVVIAGLFVAIMTLRGGYRLDGLSSGAYR